MKKAFTVSVLCTVIALSGCAGQRPSNLGPQNGLLAPCPDSPNCVSSQSADAAQAVAPLTYSEDRAAACANLKKIISKMKRAAVVEETDRYLHAEFISGLFRFVDDVEFLIDDAEKKIHVRSASRVGYSDFGVNRRRVETIRQAWEKRRRH